MSSPFDRLVPGVRVEGAVLPEPIEVLAVEALGSHLKVIGRGCNTN